MAAPNTPYKFALFGPTNAGKTVYLTTLYSHGGNEDDSVSAHVAASDCNNDITHEYLTKAYDQLRAGQWPDATVFEKLNSINFTITSGGVQSKVQIPDVAGEVTGRGNKIENWTEFEHRLKQEILDEFSEYDGFLIFAPAGDAIKEDSILFKWEVDSLLLALKERASSSGVIRRPVAVILSKWDIVASEQTSEIDEAAVADEHFRRKYPETATGLNESCENWRVFPVSATGPIKNGRPPETLCPTGVVAPIIWLLRTADRTSLERADEYFKKHEQKFFAKPNTDSSETYAQRAMQRYEDILAKSPDAETMDQSKVGIARISQIIRSRKRRRLAAYGGVILALPLVTFAIVDYLSYEAAVEQLTEAGQVAEELDPALVRADNFLNSPLHPISSLLGWKKDLKRLVTERESNWEADWKDELTNYVYEDTTRAKELVTGCNMFLERFKDSDCRLEIERLRDETNGFVDQHEGKMIVKDLMERDANLLKISPPNISQLEQWVLEAETFLDDPIYNTIIDRRSEVQTALDNRRALLANLYAEKNWAALKRRYAELGESPYQQYLMVRDWLAQKGQAQTSHADEAEQMSSRSLSLADSKAWHDLQEYKTKNSTNYQRHLEKAYDYLDIAEFEKHRKDVLAFIQRVNDRRDRQIYRFIREEIKSRELTGNQLVKIQKRCEDYLDSSDRPVAMRKSVEAWLAWYRQLQEGVTLAVKLQSVKVDRGSRWHSYFYYPDVFVTVKINGRTDKTAEKELSLGVDTSGFGKNKLGPFPWKMGDQDVVVMITCTEGENETLTCDFPQDTFKLRHLNGSVSFDDGRITARLQCSAASPPTLPPYEAVP